MTHLFLIGMPGVGKTWWGSRVAPRLSMTFTDLDEQLMYRYRDTIPGLFEKFGEDGFRMREHELLQRLILNLTTPTLIACGGGTPCFWDNMSLMKAAGLVVYLRADMDYLTQKLAQTADRPLLPENPDERAAKLQQLLTQRAPIYEQADATIDVSKTDISTFEQIIRSCTRKP